ncbi:glycosyltransferase family 4 protein [Nocardioides sp. SYSU DS0663]|uniref:glycosyltransferase family 4 protein n=1 Tax=Nocardioides sp. SYSU DS0663 TaxID=3416445 RepID=UPI003F4C31CC
MSLRIAMLGTRGLPATFGGIEHHVEQVGRRLVERGHEVTVYSQRGYSGQRGTTTHHGMTVVQVPSVASRSLEALAHAGLSTVAAMHARHDVLHYHAVGPGVAAPLPRAVSHAAVVQTIHGLDAERDKWGRGARAMLRGATWLSARVPHRTVTVSATLKDHYAARYGRECTYIPNGTSPRPRAELSAAARDAGVEPGRYVLFVGRLVPEKRPDLLIRAWADVPTDLRLVVVGGSSYTDEYVEELHALAAADDRVLMPGYAFGDELDGYFSSAGLFVQPSALEGLPLTLLEAVGSRLPSVVSDIPPHLEVVGGDRPGARVFATDDRADLVRALSTALADLDGERRAAGVLADDVLARYDWDRCTDELEQVYLAAAGRRSVG